MKPIVLFVKETDGKVTMDADTLSKLIDQVYEIGKQDGISVTNQPITIQPLWNPLKNEKLDFTTCEVTE